LLAAIALPLGGAGRTGAIGAQAERAPTLSAFRTGDGVLLRGHRYGAGKHWVIFVADGPAEASAWHALPRKLSRDGYQVLVFDLRGHGASARESDAAHAPLDVVAALDFAYAQGACSRSVIGAGSGATAALVAAGVREVTALVALSPRAGLHGVPRDAIGRGRGPKLIMVGWLDRFWAAQAEEVFHRSIGWTVLQSFPVSAERAALLSSTFADHVYESALAFLREYGGSSSSGKSCR
jgi:pimeloyl-ACP methyl ester carboxylesterase